MYCVGVSSEPGSSSCCVLGPEQSPAGNSPGPVRRLSPGAVQQPAGRVALSAHLHRAGCLVDHSSWMEYKQLSILLHRSDSTGRRKPLIIIPSLGGILTLGAYTLNVYHTVSPCKIQAVWYPSQSWPAEGLLLSSVYSLFGGYTTSLLGTYTFLAASTPPHQRTSRIALLHVCSTVGWVAGTMASPGIFHSWGYTGTFITSLVFASTGLALTSLLLTEPPLALRPPDNSPPSHSPLQGLLQAYRCLVKRRPGNTR